MTPIKWEMFFDESYFGTWVVREAKDRRFFSPRSFHFSTREEALAFYEAAQKTITESIKDVDGNI